jgi:hypothetical protein
VKPEQGEGLTCVECDREQAVGERGSRAYLTTDEDDPAGGDGLLPRVRG